MFSNNGHKRSMNRLVAWPAMESLFAHYKQPEICILFYYYYYQFYLKKEYTKGL